MKSIEELEHKYNCKVSFRYENNEYLLEQISIISIPCVRVYKSYEHMVNDTAKILKVIKAGDNVYSLVFQNEDFNSINKTSLQEDPNVDNDNVIPLFKDNEFSLKNKKREGIQLAESDPKELERACLFVNNVYKVRSEQSEEYIKFTSKGKE